jgi:MFS family permease
MSLSLLLIGIANNAVIPLEHKITVIYNISEGKVTLSVILSFLIFSIINFPANHIIDTKGLRVSFLIGTSLYTIGMFFYVFINKSYYFVIIGTIFMGLGQPFIMNCPAKVAAFWFSPKNVYI